MRPLAVWPSPALTGWCSWACHVGSQRLEPHPVASVLNGPVKGPSGIRSVFSATAAMYETIVFTHDTTQGSKTYIEWDGKALGGLAAAGVTALSRNAVGKIESVRLMHRPLAMVRAFSAGLARRLEGKLDPAP